MTSSTKMAYRNGEELVTTIRASGLVLGYDRRTLTHKVGTDGTTHLSCSQTVFVFLIMLTSGLQFLVQKMNYKRDLNRIEWITQQARSAAWGTRSTPPEGQRKVSIMVGCSAEPGSENFFFFFVWTGESESRRNCPL